MLSLAGFADALSERNFLRALLLEFVGVGIFQLFSGALPVETINDQPNYTDNITAATIAVVNGLLYAALGTPSRHLTLMLDPFCFSLLDT